MRSLSEIQAIFARYGGSIDMTDYHINLIGIRHLDSPNKFNDELIYFRFIKSKMELVEIQKGFTTDPGTHYLKNPTNSLGTAILKEGWHKDIWKPGNHKSQYYALVQAKPCTVYRDSNRDDKFNLDKTSTGMYGINLHRANAKLTSKQVDKWSAGCQVLADPNEFNDLMNKVKVAVQHGQKTFSYLLLTV
jgi:hypothetical protein